MHTEYLLLPSTPAPTLYPNPSPPNPTPSPNTPFVLKPPFNKFGGPTDRQTRPTKEPQPSLAVINSIYLYAWCCHVCPCVDLLDPVALELVCFPSVVFCIPTYFSACLVLVCLPLCWSVCLCIGLFVFVLVCLSLCLSVCLCVGLFVFVLVCLSLCWSVCLCVGLFAFMLVCFPMWWYFIILVIL